MTRARDNASIFAADGSLNISTSVNLDDNEKALFGASDDLQIYHTGSTSYIFEQGTGDLRIRGSEVRIEDGDGSTIALFREDQGAQLRYNGDIKLESTNTGVDVTGAVTADDNVTIAGTNPKVTLTDTDGPYESRILQTGSNTEIKNDNGGNIRFFTGSNGEVLRLAPSYDIQIYDGAGTNYAIFDASTQRLGLGTTSPDAPIEIESSGSDYATFKLNAPSNTTPAAFLIRAHDGDFDIRDANNSATRLTIDNAGKVGIGTTAPDHLLHVKTTGTDYIFAETTGSSNNIGFRMKNGDTDWYLLNDANGDLDFYNATQATTPFTIVADTSFVGIGTTAPTEMLEVYRSDAVPSIKVRAHSSTTGTYYASKLQFELSAASDATRDWDLVAEDPSDDGGHMAIRYEEDEKFRVENDGAIFVKSYVDATARPFTGTGGSGGWSKIGTISSFTQGGHTINVRIYTHAGYNASNAQDMFLDIYMKTSNFSSTNSSGGSGINAWHHQIGFRESQLQVKWVANAAGVSATAYDLYVELPDYTNGSHYEVIKRLGDWTHVGNTAQTDPGSDSSTVLSSQACGSSFVGTSDGLTRIRAEGSGNLRTNVQQGLAKAWAKIDGTGTPGIDDDYNISSLTDNATGARTIAIGNDMNNSNHCVTTACMGDRVSIIGAQSDDTYSTSAVQYRNNDSRDATFVDTTRENLTIHGDLA